MASDTGTLRTGEGLRAGGSSLADLASRADARAGDVASLGPAPAKPEAPPGLWDVAAAVGSLAGRTAIAIRDRITAEEIETVAGWIVGAVVGAATRAAIERASGGGQ